MRALLLCLLLVGAARAQTFERFGVRDGLPSEVVNAVELGPDGTLWIATDDGLARYDGHGFRVWRHLPSDAASIPSSRVLSVEPADGGAWVGTTAGLAWLDLATGHAAPVRSAPAGVVRTSSRTSTATSGSGSSTTGCGATRPAPAMPDASCWRRRRATPIVARSRWRPATTTSGSRWGARVRPGRWSAAWTVRATSARCRGPPGRGACSKAEAAPRSSAPSRATPAPRSAGSTAAAGGCWTAPGRCGRRSGPASASALDTPGYGWHRRWSCSAPTAPRSNWRWHRTVATGWAATTRVRSHATARATSGSGPRPGSTSRASRRPPSRPSTTPRATPLR